MARLKRSAPPPGGKRRAAPLPEGVELPPELADPEHELWGDGPAYREWMFAQGWARSLPGRDRLMAVPDLDVLPVAAATSPGRREERRRAAIRAWAIAHDLDLRPGGAGWQLVRELTTGQ